MAYRVQQRGFRNISPPNLQTVVLMPRVEGYEPSEEFTDDMFTSTGIFAHTPLNHYLMLLSDAGTRYYINAGFLLDQFAWGDKVGYKALKTVVGHANQKSKPNNTSPETTSAFQTDSTGVR